MHYLGWKHCILFWLFLTRCTLVVVLAGGRSTDIRCFGFANVNQSFNFLLLAEAHTGFISAHISAQYLKSSRGLFSFSFH